MKASEIRHLTDQELELKEHNLREELFKTRFQKFTGELANTAKIKRTKRDLARVVTERVVRLQKVASES
jgi:large subunit ribosomal protein L29